MSVKVYWASKKEDVFEAVHILHIFEERFDLHKISNGTIYVGSGSITVHTREKSTLYPYSGVKRIDFFRACQEKERWI